jgi:hypothetical protein
MVSRRPTAGSRGSNEHSTYSARTQTLPWTRSNCSNWRGTTATASRPLRDDVIEDVWVVADGDLARLVSAAHLAVIDFRDLRLNADARRAQG